MLIRRLSAGDIAAFRRLRQEAVIESPTAFLMDAAEIAAIPDTAIATDFAGRGDSAVFGTFIENALVAVIGVRQETFAKRRHLATIWGVYTTPSARRRGLCRAMLRHALQHARENTAILALLLYVNPANAGAKTLYQSFGFITIGHQPMSLCIDGKFVAEELMMLTLTDIPNQPQ